MEKDSTSFWADIKKYEDTLARDPNSYCFAPLSEVYRRLGLLDDAISTAMRGVEIHPDYVGGYMALGRAYYEKGMRREARESLEKVARATPENLLAQKLLSQVFLEEGNIAAAEKALGILISFNPEDSESRIALEALQRGRASQEEMEPAIYGSAGAASEESATVSTAAGFGLGTVYSEGVPSSSPAEHPGVDGIPGYDSAFDEQGQLAGPAFSEEEGEPAPLPTITLAELYEAQGYHERAMAVYRELLTNDPGNEVIRHRVAGLQERMETDLSGISPVPSAEEEDALLSPLSSGATPSLGAVPAESGEETSCPVSRDEVVETLEKWLDSIRRERACR